MVGGVDDVAHHESIADRRRRFREGSSARPNGTLRRVLARQTCPVTDSWQVRHFSQSNPVGNGQGNVPALLRRVATSIEQLGNDVEIQDVVFHDEQDDQGDSVPMITVYFHRSGND